MYGRANLDLLRARLVPLHDETSSKVSQTQFSTPNNTLFRARRTSWGRACRERRSRHGRPSSFSCHEDGSAQSFALAGGSSGSSGDPAPGGQPLGRPWAGRGATDAHHLEIKVDAQDWLAGGRRTESRPRSAPSSPVSWKRRIHYLLEPDWRADQAIQGLGRTHRTHQASAPLFRPVSTAAPAPWPQSRTAATRL